MSHSGVGELAMSGGWRIGDELVERNNCRLRLPPWCVRAMSPRGVCLERCRTEQVLLNLLSNAIKFTPIGSVRLRAEVVENGWFKISVTDTGVGIKEADMAILFQPFRQVDNRPARQHDGTGLGLAISLKLAELMGGRLEAQSEPGKGSVFTFWLPREALPAKPPLPPTAPA